MIYIYDKNSISTIEEHGATIRELFGLCPMLNLNLSERDLMHIGLGIAAMIPGVGIIASGIDAALYFQEGNYVDGLISVAGCIASVGKAITTIAKVGKVSCTAFKVGMVMRAVGTGYIAGAMGRYSIDFAKDAYQAWKDNGEEWSPDVTISLAKAAVCAAGALGAIAELGNCVGEMAEVAGKGMACFTAGTQVLTDEGLKNIEDIQAGDYVYSTDEETGESGYKEVLNTFAKETEVLTHVSYELRDDSLSEYEEYYRNEESINHNNREEAENKNQVNTKSQAVSSEHSHEIITTMNHRFWCEGSWKTAGTLETGDILTLANGSEAIVTSVAFEAKHTTVYNMEVADYHTYYVGEDSVWVHNMCDVQPGTSVKTKSSDELTPSGESGTSLNEFDIAPYGEFKNHPGDNLTGHELLQNAWLEANKKSVRGDAVSRQNPAIALYEDPMHKFITNQQRTLGLNKRNLEGVSWRKNIIDNIQIMKAAGVPRDKIAELAKASRKFALDNGF